MPFFPRFHYPESTIQPYSGFPTDILRLFEDFDHSSSSSSNTNTSTGRRAFSPNFDVHETEHAYILEGELPGLSDKKNLSIEFTDDKTILVHGKIERSLKGYRDESGKIKEIEGSEEQKRIESDGGSTAEGQKSQQKKEQGPKFWVSERSVGEFSRSFSFPTHVDVDNVKASLEHGILKVVVPKMEKRAGRRIEVS